MADALHPPSYMAIRFRTPSTDQSKPWTQPQDAPSSYLQTTQHIEFLRTQALEVCDPACPLHTSEARSHTRRPTMSWWELPATTTKRTPSTPISHIHILIQDGGATADNKLSPIYQRRTRRGRGRPMASDGDDHETITPISSHGELMTFVITLPPPPSPLLPPLPPPNSPSSSRHRHPSHRHRPKKRKKNQRIDRSHLLPSNFIRDTSTRRGCQLPTSRGHAPCLGMTLSTLNSKPLRYPQASPRPSNISRFNE